MTVVCSMGDMKDIMSKKFQKCFGKVTLRKIPNFLLSSIAIELKETVLRLKLSRVPITNSVREMHKEVGVKKLFVKFLFCKHFKYVGGNVVADNTNQK